MTATLVFRYCLFRHSLRRNINVKLMLRFLRCIFYIWSAGYFIL